MIHLRDALSITEFCQAHGFSRASYYNLPIELRPREMRIGGRVLISRESAEEWRRLMEAKTAEREARRVREPA